MEAREDLVLELVALSGDFPEQLLGALSGNLEWTRKVTRSLIQDNLLRRYKKDGIKSLRLTKRGRQMLIKANAERFDNLVDGSGALRGRKSDLRSRLRYHQIAGAYVMMLQADVLVHKDQKLSLTGNTSGKLLVPSFYSSIEIKDPEALRIKSTRAVGMLITADGGNYLVYNTGNTLLKWSSRNERKLAGAMQEMLRARGCQTTEFNGMMTGTRMETALLLLRSDGGYRKQLYQVDYTFPSLQYVPLNSDGIQQLRYLCSGFARGKLRSEVMGGMPSPHYPRYVCDVIDGETPVLFAWEFDLPKLRQFHGGLEQFAEHGRVICFDYQAAVLRQYFSNLADIQELDSHKIWRWLFGT